MAADAAAIGAVTISPASTSAGVAASVLVTAQITDAGLIAASVNLQQLDAQGRVTSVVGTLRDDGAEGDQSAGDQIFSIRFPIFNQTPGQLRYRVSAAFQGVLTRPLSTILVFNVTGSFATGVSLTQPANLAFINTSPIIVAGSSGDPGASVRVNNIQASKSGNNFQTTVPLQEGNNTITAVATNTNGTTSTASIQVTLDTTPPRLTIDSPANGFETVDASVTVSGIVNDIVVGTVNAQQATVRVNGVLAQVANRTFTASIPLVIGANTIQVVGTDQTGNSATTSLVVHRIQPTQPSIRLISGNNQSGVIGAQLSQPLIVELRNGASQPVANTAVIFKVTENDGFLAPGQNKPQLISVNTNTQGRAQANFTLGNRAGSGNNTVEAYAANFVGTALFVASANPKPPAKINVDSGNNQFGPVGQPLALPFVAVVTDEGHNRLPNVPVTFTVRQGGGNFAGATTRQTVSDSDGRVLAVLTLGAQPGQDNNVVEANFVGNTGFAAGFTASAKIPGNPAQTSISGVVLDNSNNPIPGVTIRLFQTNQGSNNNQPMQVGTPVQTNAQGTFLMAGAPVGFFKLMADGTTAVQGGKMYPTLEYDIVTVAGQDNTVGMPIYLPALDPLAKVCVDQNTGGVLKIADSPGFSLTILPGSATFPGGSKTGCVSVTPVNPDKVPMVPGFGQQPRYVVTIQPVGTTFNAPAAITIPNIDGLAPNAKTEMYSFDHDLAAFVAIGSGTVSPDGSVIASDPGVGVIKAGWHCGGNPNSAGSAGTCPDCKKCEGSNCVTDASRNNQTCTDDNQQCTLDKCQGGSCVHPAVSVELVSVMSPSEQGNPAGPNSFIQDDNVKVTGKTKVAGFPNLDGQQNAEINWKIQNEGPRAGTPTPTQGTGEMFQWKGAPNALLTTGSTAANPALGFKLTARYKNEAAACLTVERIFRQDERDVIRQEHKEFTTLNADVPIPNRSDLAAPPITTPNLNGSNYSLVYNGTTLLGLLDSFVAQMNSLLALQDAQLVPPCTCAPADQACITANAQSCNIAPTTPVVRASINTTSSRPAATGQNRRVIIFHSTPGGDDTFDTQGNILAGPNRRAETMANTISFPAYSRASFTVNSGYRNPRRNVSVGSQFHNSKHVKGQALDINDFVIPGTVAVPGVPTANNSRCIAEVAGDNAVGAANAISERGGVAVACDDTTLTHLHIQQ